MHAYFYNEAIFTFTLRPRTPLLIKSGRSGEDALDPTLPDMSFVRMRRPDSSEEELFIPGSSLRGVVRSHAEKLLRSVRADLACDPTRHSKGQNGPAIACFSDQPNTDAISGDQAYNGSCYACRIFGNTALAGRVRMNDLYLQSTPEPLLSRRYGIAIDRITGAVAQGPFEQEILTDALFSGRITVRNFTLGHLGLLAAALLDLHDGLVPMGYGKSRGLGRVQLTFTETTIRTLKDPAGELLGIGALAAAAERTRYQLPAADTDRQKMDALQTAAERRGFYQLTVAESAATMWLEELAKLWVTEAGQLPDAAQRKANKL